MHTKFHVHSLSHRGYKLTVTWAILSSLAVVGSVAAFARATHNFSAALSEKPDLAIYLLLPDEEIGQTTLLRESEKERDYLAETKEGPKLVKLRKGEKEWFVSVVEKLHE